ncbi:MAG: hypothetical protein J6K15_12960, partial [Lachnospiraceae bacterium]|nr:hypothetical protein [Lachnospiraceae bacterium]
RRDIRRLVLAAGSHCPGFAVPFLKRLLSSSTFYFLNITTKINESQRIFWIFPYFMQFHETS